MAGGLNAFDQQGRRKIVDPLAGTPDAPSSGVCFVAGEESRSNANYGTLPTPDVVEDLVLPADGLIVVRCMAEWKTSGGNTNGSVAIYLNEEQLRIATDGVPSGQGLASSANANIWKPIFTSSAGMSGGVGAAGTSSGSPVTTGQVIGGYGLEGGACEIFAAAGTYDVSIRYATRNGATVSARNRRLWVEVKPFERGD